MSWNLSHLCIGFHALQKVSLDEIRIITELIFKGDQSHLKWATEVIVKSVPCLFLDLFHAWITTLQLLEGQKIASFKMALNQSIYLKVQINIDQQENSQKIWLIVKVGKVTHLHCQQLLSLCLPDDLSFLFSVFFCW